MNGHGDVSEVLNRKPLSHQMVACLALPAAALSSFSCLLFLEFSKARFKAAKRSHSKPFETERTGVCRHLSGLLGCHFHGDGLKQKENFQFYSAY